MDSICTGGSTICLKCFTYDPWPMVVVGSLPELGKWDPIGALPMQLEKQLDDLHEWRISFHCPARRPFEFKFAAITECGTLWEAGENRACWPDEEWVEMADVFRMYSGSHV